MVSRIVWCQLQLISFSSLCDLSVLEREVTVSDPVGEVIGDATWSQRNQDGCSFHQQCCVTMSVNMLHCFSEHPITCWD